MEAWQEYEIQVLRHHIEKHGHEAWHWSNVPEDHLYDAGIIHSFNRHRLLRLARRREAAGNPIRFGDYGIDVLARSTNEDGGYEYHAVQAKHYTSRKVGANDLGTFFLVMLSQIKGNGYLYTSGQIEVNLQHNMLNTPRLVHERLPYARAIEEPAVDERPKGAGLHETVLPLRPYQREAIDAVKGAGIEIVEQVCGSGKTLVLGHILKRDRHHRVLCIAPLKASVEQLHVRIQAFLPEYEHLVVDSDYGATTDLGEITERMKTEKPMVIYSTFKSAVDLLDELLDGTEYLVVDEVHNAVGRDALCQFINEFQSGLLLSATVPEELYEMVECEKSYTYTMAQAINDGYVVDYEVYLPLVVYNKRTDSMEVRIEEPPEGLESDLAAKALFLATGMLRTGSRRCIVYLTSCAECDEFAELFRKVVEEYHGMELWCEKIDNSVGGSERKRILEEFQADFDGLRVITSVRILDEAIDIPRCDSTFITCVGDATSDIRTVQRIMRASRLDSKNPTKKNSVFLWAEEMDHAVTSLSLMKEYDINFTKKVRVIDANYDRTDYEFSRKLADERMKDLKRYIAVKCFTLWERFVQRCNEWQEMYDQLGRMPKRSKHSTEKENEVSRWQTSMRMRKKSNNLTTKQISLLESLRGWQFEIDKFENRCNEWAEFYEKNKRIPVRSATDKEENSLAVWAQSFRRTNEGKEDRVVITLEKKARLDKLPGWTWNLPDPFVQGYENWSYYYNKLGKNPSIESEDPEERKAGAYVDRMRQAYKGKGKITQEQITFLEKDERWTWEANPFMKNYIAWNNMCEKLSRNLNVSSNDKEEKSLASWESLMRGKIKGTERYCNLSDAQKQLLINNKWWRTNIDKISQSFDRWKKITEELGVPPSTTSENAAHRTAAKWAASIKLKMRNGELSEERIKLFSSYEKWIW